MNSGCGATNRACLDVQWLERRGSARRSERQELLTSEKCGRLWSKRRPAQTCAPQRCLLISIIIIQDIVHLTEVRTLQQDIDSNYQLGHRRLADELKIKNNIKISPTRIRLQSNDQIYGRLSNRRLEYETDRSTNSKATTKAPSNQHGHLGSKRKLLYSSPAYELWPNVAGNQVVIAAERRFEKQANQKWMHINDKANREHIDDDEPNQASRRNLLPRPMDQMDPSHVHRRSYNLKSLLKELKASPIYRNNHRSRRTLNQISVGSQVDSDDGGTPSAEPGVDERDKNDDIVQDDEDSRVTEENQINYKVLDDDQVLEKAETARKMTLSPVYPPGDPELLYSDALLVYVKDFNQYI